LNPGSEPLHGVYADSFILHQKIADAQDNYPRGGALGATCSTSR
jgi:hypothetical protein